jgi:hypothetical protein
MARYNELDLSLLILLQTMKRRTKPGSKYLRSCASADCRAALPPSHGFFLVAPPPSAPPHSRTIRPARPTRLARPYDRGSAPSPRLLSPASASVPHVLTLRPIRSVEPLRLHPPRSPSRLPPTTADLHDPHRGCPARPRPAPSTTPIADSRIAAANERAGRRPTQARRQCPSIIPPPCLPSRPVAAVRGPSARRRPRYGQARLFDVHNVVFSFCTLKAANAGRKDFTFEFAGDEDGRHSGRLARVPNGRWSRR